MLGRFLTAFMRFFFRLLYHSFAWTYNAVAAVVSMGQWVRWVRSVLPFLRGDVLELGFGPGHLQQAMLESGMRPVGIDESWQMVRPLLHRLKKLQPRVMRARAEFIPLASMSFDMVVATFPSEYIFSAATLHEIFRVLRPGGELIILISASITGTSISQRLLRQIYAISGQGNPPPQLMEKVTERMRVAGLDPKPFWIEQKNAQLLLIRAGKHP